jgi:hypothetical protein
MESKAYAADRALLARSMKIPTPGEVKAPPGKFHVSHPQRMGRRHDPACPD